MPDPMKDALYAADLPHLESLGLPSIDENDWQGLMNIHGLHEFGSSKS
jgi:hypothetical protein